MSVRFDDPNLVSCAGLGPAMALAARCGLATLVTDRVKIAAKGGANATAAKVLALVAGMVAGACAATCGPPVTARGQLFRAEKNNVGRPLRYASAQELWSKYCRVAGMEVSLHQLRHSHATELINDGVPVETVRKRLGHRNIAATLLYAEKSDRAADDDIRAWQRRRTRRTPNPAPAPRSEISAVGGGGDRLFGQGGGPRVRSVDGPR